MNTIIVAGITRSGLSLTMQMLHSGGYPCEGEWPAFEPHALDQIPWNACVGRAVKLVDSHLHLPPPGAYRVIRLHRNPKQQAKSVNKWLKAFGFPKGREWKLIESFERDYAIIDKWAAEQAAVLHLSFELLIQDTLKAANRLRDFALFDLDINKMIEVVVERGTDCYPTLLELTLLENSN